MVVQSSDFTTAFVVVGLISAASAFIFLRMPRSAGASLSAPVRPLPKAQEQVTEASVDI
jgi:hypothetical protein